MRAETSRGGQMLQLMAGVVGIWLCLATGWAVEIKAVPQIETEVIALKSLSEHEARQLAEMLISREGKIGYLASKRLLIIHDFPGQIKAVKEALAAVDSEPVNIRIRVDFNERSNTRHGEAGVDVREVTVRRNDGDTEVDARLRAYAGAGKTAGTKSTSSSILTTSGREASIWVGETAYDSAWVYREGLTRGWWERGMVRQEFGVSLWARPRVLHSGMIEVTVFPRIASRGRRAVSVDVQELSTKVVVPNNGSVQIGGFDDTRKESYLRLFGVGRLFDGRSLNITLTPTILRPRGRPAIPSQ